MSAPHVWTAEEAIQARALRAEGLSYTKIAAAIGVTPFQAYWHLVRKDRPHRSHLSPWRENPALHDMMCALLDEGHSRAEVARRMGMGMTKNAIIGRCHRTGLSKERYTGPTTLEQLAALNRGMDDLFEWQNMIFGSRRVGYRTPPQKKSTVRHLGASLSGGFGVRALGHGQNGSRSVRGLP